MTPERIEKFRKVVSKRQHDMTVILENVHDQHNIGAVMRTCDSIGIHEIFILQTDENLQFSNLALGKRTSAGTRRWVDVHYFTNRAACFKIVREKCQQVFATHLDADAVSLHDLDMTQPIALLFGNEKEGVTPETLALCDGNFIIPQMGLVQSLNISVACAVSLYEALRQRKSANMYNEIAVEDFSTQKKALYDLYKSRHEGKYEIKKVLPSKFDLS